MNRTARAVLATVLTVAVGSGASASAGADAARRGDFEVAVAAIPTTARPADLVHAARFDSTRARTVRVTGTATASMTCSGCLGHAESLQVVYAGRADSLDVRNVAVAWSAGCGGCAGWALSMQVVVARSVPVVHAANRALALNAACVWCRTSSAAVQFVVVGATGAELSGAAERQLLALRDQLAAQLAAPARLARPSPATAGRARRPASTLAPTGGLRAITGRIAAVLTADLHAAATHPDLRVGQG